MSNLRLVPDRPTPLDDPAVCVDLMVRELLRAEAETEPLPKLLHFTQAVTLAHCYRAAKAAQRLEDGC